MKMRALFFAASLLAFALAPNFQLTAQEITLCDCSGSCPDGKCDGCQGQDCGCSRAASFGELAAQMPFFSCSGDCPDGGCDGCQGQDCGCSRSTSYGELMAQAVL